MTGISAAFSSISQVQPNLTNVWKPTLTGYGTAEVEILLDGEHYRTYEVDFDEGTSTQID